MPVVEVFMRRGRTPAEIQMITDTLHDALVEAYEVPRGDRFQIVHQLEPHEFVFDAHFMGPRSEKFLLVRVTGGRDRPVLTKRKLYSLIADNVERHGAVARSDVFVIVDNVQPTDFSVSNGHPFDQASLGLPPTTHA